MVTLTFLLLILIIPITGLLLAATPWLMRGNECFAVTVPASRQSDPRLTKLKRGYTKAMIAMTAGLTAIALLILLPQARGGAQMSEEALAAMVLAETLLPIFVSFALMLRNRRAVQSIKTREGWFADQRQTVAIVAEQDVPGPVSLAWNLLYAPITLSALGLAATLYPIMPEIIPMQVDFAGEITNSVEKGPVVFLFPLLVSVFIALTMLFCHYTILLSKKPVDPRRPATSALAYGMFARAQSAFLLAVGLILTAAIDYGFVLAAAGMVSLGVMGAGIMAIALVVLIGAVALSITYGQAGSRLLKRMQQAEGDAMPFDDDDHWVLGIFYFNKDDASLFLPERFGIGWTVNLARPAVWVILVILVLLTAAFVAACLTLTG